MTGAALNPLLYLAPAAVCRTIHVNALAYSLAPMAGALVAGFVYKWGFLSRRPESLAGSLADYQRDYDEILFPYGSLNADPGRMRPGDS
mmetsp:Transcript_30113/g.70847  ORF Transcript_30113/g.70847 Transcript_30113/m.70847 type:complete len:89 (+) Transcript_30113:421-687(+)